jgi:hypothetical protein
MNLFSENSTVRNVVNMLYFGIFVNILPSISGNAAVVTWFIVVASRLPFPYKIVLCLAVAEFKRIKISRCSEQQ